MHPTDRVPRLRLMVVREGTRKSLPQPIRNGRDVVDLAGAYFRSLDREECWMLALDGKHQPLGFHQVSVGTLTTSLVHPRECFKALILANAAAGILVHNHPSGDPTPSAEDLAITERLREVGILVGIALLDHVVIGANGAFASCFDT